MYDALLKLHTAVATAMAMALTLAPHEFSRVRGFWIPEGSLAGFIGCRETALDLVCGADLSYKLMCGAGPGDLGGVPGVGFGRKSWENGAENGQPDCLQVPRWARPKSTHHPGPRSIPPKYPAKWH